MKLSWLFVALACIGVSASQTPPVAQDPGTGLLLGTIIDGVTGTPLANAAITISGSAAPGQDGILTGSDGRFLFTGLKAGRYSASAARDGYQSAGFFSVRPGMAGTTVEIAAGQRMTDLVVRLWPTATISGIVLDDAGEPVIGIDVRALARRYSGGRMLIDPNGVGSVRTDDRGAFRFAGLNSGDYVVVTPISQSTVSSSLLERYMREGGSPLARDIQSETFRAGGNVDLMPPGTSNSMRMGDLVVSNNAGMRSATDVNGAPKFVYATTYYPAASKLSGATIVHVKPGESRTGLTLQLTPVVTRTITGVLTGPSGPIPFTRVAAVPAGGEMQWLDFETSATITDAAGAFALGLVPPGQYTLKVEKVPRITQQTSTTTVVQSGGGAMSMSMSSGPIAMPPLPPDPVLWASLPIVVGDSDIKDVALMARRGARIQGQLQFVGSAKAPDERQIASSLVRLIPVNGRTTVGSGQVRVSGTGEVTSQGFAGGKYIVAVSGVLPGWSLESVMHGGVDVADTPLDLDGADVTDLIFTFTDRKTEVSGTLNDAAGNPDAGATVVAFPTNPALTNDVINPRRVRSARVGANGRYTLAGLPPGDYFVVGLPADDMTWNEPRVRQTLAAQATRVTIAWNQPAHADLVTKKVQ